MSSAARNLPLRWSDGGVGSMPRRPAWSRNRLARCCSNIHKQYQSPALYYCWLSPGRLFVVGGPLTQSSPGSWGAKDGPTSGRREQPEDRGAGSRPTPACLPDQARGAGADAHVGANWLEPSTIVGCTARPRFRWPLPTNMRTQSASSTARSRAKTPDPVARARTPGTPDTTLSRRATPEGIRPRPASTDPGAIEGGAALRRAASATAASRLKKPKVFCEEDFKKFLARQEQHRAAQARHLVIPNGLIAGLRPTPLLPIMNGNGYVIQGAIYVEADWRSKPQQGDLFDPSLCALRIFALSPLCLARAAFFSAPFCLCCFIRTMVLEVPVLAEGRAQHKES
jgi:hypothetical protein